MTEDKQHISDANESALPFVHEDSLESNKGRSVDFSLLFMVSFWDV
jgi:hypothetical protein